MSEHREIPLPTVNRFCIYQRFLQKLKELRMKVVSSADIGHHTGIPAYQVRKDINHLGGMGTAGKGYVIDDLLERIENHLGLGVSKDTAVVGMGALGTAITGYLSERQRQYNIVASFDNDPGRIGASVGDVPVLDVRDMPDFLLEHPMEIGIVTVPAAAAQQTADTLVRGGILGILNFAPVILDVPENVITRSIDFSRELGVLSYLTEKAR